MAALAITLGGAPARAAPAPDPAASDLTQVQLEDLLQIRVTAASRREQRLADVPAAITVITRDQIRATGATTLAEVLRLAPGVQVARIDASMWSVSARGFSGRIANKLLLLVDGRSVYSPLFSGVYWDELDIDLDDIDRIEVIRGPGGSVWGANAVNGVIDVITRRADVDPGTVLAGAIGSEQRGASSARWAGPLGDRAALRVYGRGQRWSGDAAAGHGDAWDDWTSFHGGFRAESRTPRADLTLMGDLRGGDAGMSLVQARDEPPYQLQIAPRTLSRGGYVLAALRRRLDHDADVTLQGCVDLSSRDDAVLKSRMAVYDLDLKHHVPGRSHDFVWGMDARVVADRFERTEVIDFGHLRQTTPLLCGFAQDEWSPAGVPLRLTAGLRVDVTQATGAEWQPTVRMLWPVRPGQVAWAAVSRAVRTPSRAEQDIRYQVSTVETGGPPAVVTMYGNESFHSERVVAYESGYRFVPSEHTLLELDAFYNRYAGLRTIEPGVSTYDPGPPAVVDVRQDWANGMHGDTRGAELSATWNATPAWRFAAGGSWLAMRLRLDPGSRDATSLGTERNEPGYQAFVQTQYHPAGAWYVNGALYETVRRAAQRLPAYTRLDLGGGCSLTRGVDLLITGTNLLRDRHIEDDGIASGVLPTAVERGVTVRLGWRTGAR